MALANAFPREHSPVAQEAHDGDEEVAVPAVLTQEVKSSLHCSERQDIHAHGSGVVTRFEDTGLESEGVSLRIIEVRCCVPSSDHESGGRSPRRT